jgi:hypothetical protein
LDRYSTRCFLPPDRYPYLAIRSKRDPRHHPHCCCTHLYLTTQYLGAHIFSQVEAPA